MADYRFHPACKAFPQMEGKPFEDLVADIKLYGLREPIKIAVDPMLGEEKWIIDGRNRFRACKEAKVEPVFKEMRLKAGESITQLAVSLNEKRRHMNASQLASLGANLKPLFEKEAKERQRAANAAKKEKERAKKERAARGEVDPPEPKEPKGDKGKTARSEAAAVSGASPRAIQDATAIKEFSPDLFAKVESGAMTVNQAKAEMNRQKKTVALDDASKEAPEPSSDTFRIITGDSCTELENLEDVQPALIFADPPYNIGIDYGRGAKHDKLADSDYLDWCKDWMGKCSSMLAKNGSMLVVINDEYAADFKLMMMEEGVDLHPRAWLKWYETFGVNNANNFNRTSRHILYFVKDPKKFIFNADAVNRPSDRQTKYNDKRANPNGKNWDDVIEIPRLTDSSVERIPGFPTQLPLALVQPLVEALSMPGDLVLDPFCGSGTTIEAAIRSKRRAIGIELSEKFADLAEKRCRVALSSLPTNGKAPKAGKKKERATV